MLKKQKNKLEESKKCYKIKVQSSLYSIGYINAKNNSG
jgi:hypothetical protein